ncbi:MAG: AmmeMemoRadiSam system protein A [Planctomycetota bacterium]
MADTEGGVRFDAASRKALLKIASDAVAAAVRDEDYNPPAVEEESLLQKGGCFVTLKTEGRLRGCLGRFEADIPICQAVARMARASAIEDPRFRYEPIGPEELSRVHIEISTLGPRRRIASWREIRLGVDGVVVRNGLKSGVFLPQVATETGWTLEIFLQHLCRDKAGLSPDAYKDPATILEVFDAEVVGSPILLPDD